MARDVRYPAPHRRSRLPHRDRPTERARSGFKPICVGKQIRQIRVPVPSSSSWPTSTIIPPLPVPSLLRSIARGSSRSPRSSGLRLCFCSCWRLKEAGLYFVPAAQHACWKRGGKAGGASFSQALAPPAPPGHAAAVGGCGPPLEGGRPPGLLPPPRPPVDPAASLQFREAARLMRRCVLISNTPTLAVVEVLTYLNPVNLPLR